MSDDDWRSVVAALPDPWWGRWRRESGRRQADYVSGPPTVEDIRRSDHDAFETVLGRMTAKGLPVPMPRGSTWVDDGPSVAPPMSATPTVPAGGPVPGWHVELLAADEDTRERRAERAAILEYDAGLGRVEAESRAWSETRPMGHLDLGRVGA